MNDGMQIVWDDGERLLCRGRRATEAGDRAVLMTRPAAEQPLPASLERLAHEFSLRDELGETWAVQPLELVREQGQNWLVLEDPGGELLAGLLVAPLPIGTFLQLAISIAVTLGSLHRRGLIHKDIKPAHILVNCADGHARLTGFGLATWLPRERQAPEAAETLAGTLAYMAPEQTGRMNRSIDSRSDLYAFGVTLYQMLTGSLPFAATDPMEWLHCHIARQPLAPSNRVGTVPPMLSRIVMKLLAKTAEDRYQTAMGLEQDLRRCLADWQQQQRIDEFALDEHGTSDHLLIPEKLYGREQDVRTLLAAFERMIGNSAPELVLVSGYSGIGKSAVVNELHKALVPPRGLFASGKFDQYKRDVPYSTLVHAFQELVRTLLGKSEAELAGWRESLREALGANARLMTDLIPELKLIIGEPPAVQDLEPRQGQRRFLRVLRRFIGVFARAEHPLALFLDDLQWLDAATLDLLEELLTRSDLRYLMLIGAYRNNEVDASHPLTLKRQAIQKAGGRVSEITLAPLAKVHIEQLIAESLHDERWRIEPLAQVVLDKTAGNPFFVIQFLQALVEEDLLAFNHDARRWCWDTDRIHAKGYTDNIVDLMVGKLVRLSIETLHALQQLACLGNVADMATLSIVLGIPAGHIHALLWDAIYQELVERRDGLYAFAHDRIQEAAYLSMGEAERAENHLRIGRLLAAQTTAQRREETIFDIVGQLNQGALLLTDQNEREQLAQFNLMAGQRARASTAYASALAYFNFGAHLLNEAWWERRPELMFELESGRAFCEFLTGQLLLAEARLKRLSQRATSIAERSLVACLQVDLYLILDQSENAVAVCLAFLRHVGIEWSPHPCDDEVRDEYQRIGRQLGSRTIEDLIDLPAMVDTVALATIEALTKLFTAALHMDGNLPGLAICKVVNLSLEHGNGDASCVAYANIPRVAGRRFGDYPAGYAYAQLGCRLVEQRGLERYLARTHLCFSIFVARWFQPVRSCREPLRRVFEVANRTGDLPFGAFACNSLVSDMLFTGEPLAELHGEAERGLAYAKKIGFGLVIDFIENQLALIRTLRGQTLPFGCIERAATVASETGPRPASTSRVSECWAWIRKLQAHYLAGDYLAALEASAAAEHILWTSHSFIEEAEYDFYSALARAGHCASIAVEEWSSQLEAMEAHRRQLQVWADLCPENFASRTALVSGEIARLEGRVLDAEHHYEQAIQLAQASDFVHIEALANELASYFYAARGMAKIARVYVQDARYGYQRWGADGKVRQLEANFPALRTDTPAFTPTTTMATPVEHLDLATVLKVSQAASGDIVLEKLIETVMRIAIEQAGAERGVLILSEAGEQRIAAEATTRDDGTQLQLSDVPLSSEWLPESILYHVLRTRENVVLDDAVAGSAFAADPYIRQRRARSILCLPLTNQAKLMGALYLENNLTARVFSPSRIAVLKLVASQAAISLENARLYRDVAEREAKIRRLVDANIIGILVWTTHGDIIEANEAFLRLAGYQREDVTSGHVRWRDMTPPEYREISEASMTEAVRSGHARPFEKEYVRKDGSRVPVLVGLAMLELNGKQGVAFVLDLTERKQAEEKIRESERRYREVQTELAHANRIATMGQLAASIAHEVSQPIAATVINAHAALRWLNAQPPEIDEAQQVLTRLISDSNRAADVLGRIRGHIRKTPPQKEAVDINASINEMVEFAQGQANKYEATIITRLAPDLPVIQADRVELQQVLLNLIVNALEAMSSVSDGLRQLQISSALDEEGRVRVTVSDSGPGFAEDYAEQVFTEFYTTKPTGLGMGLSICRSIIEGLGGRLWASANQPRGAVVQFSVPAHGDVEQ